jgi:hypothetical protein
MRAHTPRRRALNSRWPAPARAARRFGAFLIANDMEARPVQCTYYGDPARGVPMHVPESSCVTGGNVMIAFFAVLFGGLNLGQASPTVSAVGTARSELGKILGALAANTKACHCELLLVQNIFPTPTPTLIRPSDAQPSSVASRRSIHRAPTAPPWRTPRAASTSTAWVLPTRRGRTSPFTAA